MPVFHFDWLKNFNIKFTSKTTLIVCNIVKMIPCKVLYIYFLFILKKKYGGDWQLFCQKQNSCLNPNSALIIRFILQSFYLSSQNALTVYLQVINGHWSFIIFRPHLLDLIDGTTFFLPLKGISVVNVNKPYI